MKLKLSNYNKPSDPKWKTIGDICLFAIPIYSGIFASLPIPDPYKIYILAGMDTILGTVKIITKFTIDKNFKENENN